MPRGIGHFIVCVVNFDQLRDRIAITIYEDQCERLEKQESRSGLSDLRMSTRLALAAVLLAWLLMPETNPSNKNEIR
jgi:hypothetical protein